MPFRQQNLISIAQRNDMFSRYDYDTRDEIAEVVGKGYFRMAFYRLRVGDRIDALVRTQDKDGKDCLALHEIVVTELTHPDVLVAPYEPPAVAALRRRVEAIEAHLTESTKGRKAA